MRNQMPVLLAAISLLACSKSNEVEVGGQPSALCSSDKACAGACVEGVCRAFCDTNYQCPSPETCIALQNGAVCVPPGEDIYPAYQPIDLLRDCQQPQGCKVPLDAPNLEGVFRQCLSFGHAETEVLATGFDFVGACTELDSYMSLFIKGRTAWRVTEDGSCRSNRAGQARQGTLVEFCESAAESGRSLQLGLVVGQNGRRYLVTPEAGDEPKVGIHVYEPGSVSGPPPGCEVPQACAALPAFPFVGEPASQYAGLWVQCDSDDDCTGTWAQPVLNGTRLVLYIRNDGNGALVQKQGDAYNPVVTRCDTAFRRTSLGHMLSIERRDSVVGRLSAARYAMSLEDEYLTAEPRLLSGEPEGSSVWPIRYKKVPLPVDFEDPCDTMRPQTKI